MTRFQGSARIGVFVMALTCIGLLSGCEFIQPREQHRPLHLTVREWSPDKKMLRRERKFVDGALVGDVWYDEKGKPMPAPKECYCDEQGGVEYDAQGNPVVRPAPGPRGAKDR